LVLLVALLLQPSPDGSRGAVVSPSNSLRASVQSGASLRTTSVAEDRTDDEFGTVYADFGIADGGTVGPITWRSVRWARASASPSWSRPTASPTMR
jgi:hypothetical protein